MNIKYHLKGYNFACCILSLQLQHLFFFLHILTPPIIY